MPHGFVRSSREALAQRAPGAILELPGMAQFHGFTNYDVAYLALAPRLAFATADSALMYAAAGASVKRLVV